MRLIRSYIAFKVDMLDVSWESHFIKNSNCTIRALFDLATLRYFWAVLYHLHRPWILLNLCKRSEIYVCWLIYSVFFTLHKASKLYLDRLLDDVGYCCYFDLLLRLFLSFQLGRAAVCLKHRRFQLRVVEAWKRRCVFFTIRFLSDTRLN